MISYASLLNISLLSIQVRNDRFFQNLPYRHIVNTEIVPDFVRFVKCGKYFAFRIGMRLAIKVRLVYLIFTIPVGILIDASDLNRVFLRFYGVPLTVFSPIKQNVQSNNLHDVSEDSLRII